MRWVEERIGEAIERGEFENLSGKGKPIQWQENPFAPPEQQLAFHLLRSNGFTLPWLETQRELQAEIDKLRKKIAQLRQTPASPHWQKRQKAQLEAQIEDLNQRIRRYNIEAPLARFHLPILDCERELEGIA
ncbi:MAG: DUF1992 domain-containing protein [Anaerolineales bacterium]|nr:DUF1992 domain-containing protein [Anaerolineales bacterium]